MFASTFRRGAISALLLTSATLALSGCTSGSVESGTPTPALLPGHVSVVNNHLYRDGQLWVPHGFFQVAFQASPLETNVPNWEAQAQANYTPAEYLQMQAAGADSVRLMIGQTAGDKDNPLFSQALVNQFITAVQTARQDGLTVIVGVQDEAIVQDPNETDLPNVATLNVWSKLIPAFGKDKGILLELFNEPGTGPTQVPQAADWQQWVTTMNATIQFIRQNGGANVVIADGLAHAGTLSGAPDLTDMMNGVAYNQVAYASHPYTFKATGDGIEANAASANAFFDASFGTFAATHPVIITEWGMGYYCGPGDPAFLINFLNYIQNKGIGLEMSFWDWGGPTAFGGTQYNWPNPITSMFYNQGVLQTCGKAIRGPGSTIYSYYKNKSIPAGAL